MSALQHCLLSHRLNREHHGHAHCKLLKTHEEPLPCNCDIDFKKGCYITSNGIKYISNNCKQFYIFYIVTRNLVFVTVQIQEQIQVHTSCRFTIWWPSNKLAYFLQKYMYLKTITNKLQMHVFMSTNHFNYWNFIQRILIEQGRRCVCVCMQQQL